jgi:hypothetical protein
MQNAEGQKTMINLWWDLAASGLLNLLKQWGCA